LAFEELPPCFLRHFEAREDGDRLVPSDTPLELAGLLFWRNALTHLHRSRNFVLLLHPEFGALVS
jgi:hypothetical protein